MFQGKRIVVVMPAYNAEQTLRTTHGEVMAQGFVDELSRPPGSSRRRPPSALPKT